MAQGDPPVYQLVDRNGNVEAEIRYNLSSDDFIIEPVGSSTVDFQDNTLSSIGSLKADKAQIVRSTDVTINVPSDESTFSDGLDAATEYVRPKDDVSVTVNIETGHVISTDAFLSRGDYSHITITSDDAVVNVDSGLTRNLINGESCYLPILDCEIDMQGNGANGLSVRDGSTAFVTSGSGIINAGARGLFVSGGSQCYALNTDFSGAATEGARVSNGSAAVLQESDFSNAGDSPLYVSRSSIVGAANGTFDNSASELICRRSRVNIQNGSVQNSNGVRVDESGTLSMSGATVDRINADFASTVDAFNASVTGGSGINDTVRATDGCTINLGKASVSNADRYGVFAESMSSVNLFETSFSSISNLPIVVGDGANIINAVNATAGGSAITVSNTNFGSANAVETDGILFL